MARFAPNDEVHFQGRPDEVGLVRSIGSVVAGVQFYDVFWGGQRRTTRVAESDLALHVSRASALEALRAGTFANCEALQLRITMERLSRTNPLRNNILAFNSSRTRFYPYQFKPLLKLLESHNRRLLIADEVGLGKTIEAGLILLEMRARQILNLVLVVCPASLLTKWRAELRDRFGERFQIFRTPELLSFFDEYEEAPDRTVLNGIVSHETLRSERVISRLEDLRIPLDFVVIDEAHAGRNPTATRHAFDLVGDGSGVLLLLTATPIHLGQRDLYSLLNLLDPADFPDQATAEARFRSNESLVRAQSLVSQQPPRLAEAAGLLLGAADSPWLAKAALLAATMQRIVRHLSAETVPEPEEHASLIRDLAELNLLGHILTRTRRRDQQASASVRRPENLQAVFSPLEQALYDAVTERIRLAAQQYDSISPSLAWRLTTPQRRMASSMPAMVAFFRESPPDWLASDDWDPEPQRLPLESTPGSNSQRSVAVLTEQIRQLVAGFPANPPDSKYDQLVTLLRGGTDKVLIFATFRHTLQYLNDRLATDGFKCELITGASDTPERQDRIDRFRSDSAIRVLLSSRVGSEGLDFQFCSTLVNYDLPWNPMEVEQRIGRLDRIGQQAPFIRIANFWTVGTIEERILFRLYERIGVFTRSIGDLEAILGDDLAGDLEALLNPELTLEQQVRQADALSVAVENRKHELRNLERSAAQFIGVDAFFDAEVDAIQERRRYITPTQLRRFVEAYLRSQNTRTRLVYDAKTGMGHLTIDNSVAQLLQEHGATAADTDLVVNVANPVAITFDGAVAEAHPELELLRPLHPLVQAIAQTRATDVGSLAYDVVLRTDKLPHGHYFFGVYKTTVHAARQYSILECVILDERLTAAGGLDLSEAILGEIAENGSSSAAGELSLPPDLLQSAASRIEETYLERREAVRSRELEGNEAFVEQRLASLRQHFHSLLRRDRELLARAVASKRQDRYIRMLRGRIVNRERELANREQELNQLRQVAIEHVEVAAGILEAI